MRTHYVAKSSTRVPRVSTFVHKLTFLFAIVLFELAVRAI
jgi:hypothetical protein